MRIENDGFLNYGEGLGQQNKRWKWRLLEIIPEQALTQYGGLSFLTNCDYDFKLLDLKDLPTFYHFVLRYWQDYKLLMPGNRIPPEHEIIWNNQNILVDNKPLFYKSWFHYDIVQVQDLLNVNREFLSFAKYYIFTTSVCDNKLSFDCFLLRLNSKLDVLRTIAIKNKSLNKFETTWAPLS